MGQLAQITATRILRRDKGIGRRGPICGPMGRLDVEGHAQFLGLARQFLRAVFLTAHVAILGQCAARPAKSRDQIEGLVIDRGPMFGRNLLQPCPGQVAIGGKCREKVIDLSHLRLLSFAAP